MQGQKLDSLEDDPRGSLPKFHDSVILGGPSDVSEERGLRKCSLAAWPTAVTCLLCGLDV